MKNIYRGETRRKQEERGRGKGERGKEEGVGEREGNRGREEGEG